VSSHLESITVSSELKPSNMNVPVSIRCSFGIRDFGRSYGPAIPCAEPTVTSAGLIRSTYSFLCNRSEKLHEFHE